MIKNFVSKTQEVTFDFNGLDKNLPPEINSLINSFEMLLSSKVSNLLMPKHGDFTTEVVLADTRKIEIEDDNYYTFYYTKEDIKDVDKYIEWVKNVL